MGTGSNSASICFRKFPPEDPIRVLVLRAEVGPPAMKSKSNVWSIVLAAGEGDRLKPLVQSWLGYAKPKQYCTFVGTRSMLQHTLDRADQVTLPDQKLTVTARAHWELGWSRFLEQKPGKVLLQPS